MLGGIPAKCRTISIHAPREGGDGVTTSTAMVQEISIHAPREGGDCIMSKSGHSGFISIHAPREGGDDRCCWREIRPTNFNPRPPRGGRLLKKKLSRQKTKFQSTPPARGATTYQWQQVVQILISIHAPREGGDGNMSDKLENIRISIHAPREGGDGVTTSTAMVQEISIHAPREGGDSKDAQFYLRIFDKQVELLRFLGKIRGGCLRNPEKDRRFLGKSLANLPEISGHLDFAGGGKARPGYPCAVPLPRRAACVRGSGDPPADRCSSYRNAPLFSHIASLDSKSADCLSQNP